MPATFVRNDEPGAIHQILVQPVDRNRIVRDDAERAILVDSLIRACDTYSVAVLAFAIAPMRLDLCVRVSDSPLWRFMKSFEIRHAVVVNRRRGRVGHFVSDRFTSRRAETREVANVIHFIHRLAREHRSGGAWDSFETLVGRRESALVSRDATLALIDADSQGAIRSLERERNRKDVLSDARIGRELAQLRRTRGRETPARASRDGKAVLRCASPEMLRRARSGSRAEEVLSVRDQVARALHAEGWTLRAIARKLGVGLATVQRAVAS